LSALDVLEGRVASGVFRDKLVVIGVTSQATTDVHTTPFDAGRGMPGAEVQANALETMLRGEPLRDVPPLVDVIAIILLACLPAGAGLRRSGRVAAAAIAAVAVVFLAAAQLSFHAGWIVAVAMPLAALVTAASGVAALAAAGAVRRRAARSPSNGIPG
jgi:CHASE2 domain-containing sensor protein